MYATWLILWYDIRICAYPLVPKFFFFLIFRIIFFGFFDLLIGWVLDWMSWMNSLLGRERTNVEWYWHLMHQFFHNYYIHLKWLNLQIILLSKGHHIITLLKFPKISDRIKSFWRNLEQTWYSQKSCKLPISMPLPINSSLFNIKIVSFLLECTFLW